MREFQNYLNNNQQEQQQHHEYICYLEGGRSETRHDSDHEPIFRQESYFHYLFGVKEPDWSGCINLLTGKTTLFMPKLPPEYATIMGKIKRPSFFREEYNVDEVKYTDEAEEYLLSQCSSSNDSQATRSILVLKGKNSDSGNEYKPPSFSSPSLQPHIDTQTLFPILAECRVIKSSHELNLLRHCTEITSLAHVYAMKHMKPGMMEYQSESLFRHYTYYNFGARHVGYTPICGCGPNGAVLHYGHAGVPNDRLIQDGDMCLMDMGAEYFCYSSDVTCSYPSNGKFTERQKVVYEGVLNAQRRVIGMLKPGVSWVECHKAAEEEIITALIELGVVVLNADSESKPESESGSEIESEFESSGNKIQSKTTVKELVEMRLGGYFMPHGLGHFIGIDTHDVGGYLPGHQNRIPTLGLKSLRTCRMVLPNMTLTVEPGLYFIDHFMDELLMESSPLNQYINGHVLNEFRGFGGVRLEDVVVVTEDGCENFTICPRTVKEVESVMTGGKWPPLQDCDATLKRKRLTDTSPLGIINMP